MGQVPRKKSGSKGEFGGLASVLASQGGPRGIAPTRLVAEPAFLAQVQALFWRNQEREASQYEQLLYNLEEARSDHDLDQLVAFRSVGPVPALGKSDVAERVRRVMRTIRYPDVEPLVALASVEGLTLPALTTVLHFHHPAYPILSEDLARGLNAIGYPVEFRREITEESVADYAGVIATLDRLKERITFENVPESNCFLTRVIEGALVETARSTRAGAAKRAPKRTPKPAPKKPSRAREAKKPKRARK